MRGKTFMREPTEKQKAFISEICSELDLPNPKCILMSIKPKYVSMILNKTKTIEVRKRFPSDYVGWVYIYCTKGKPYLTYYHGACRNEYITHNDKKGLLLNGKVVARFWCDKVEEITTREDRYKEFMFYETSLDTEELCKQSCLDYNELDNYLYGEKGKAIHITNLEIFDKPKEISEFCTTNLDKQIPEIFDNSIQLENGTWVKPLTRAPESYRYIEIGE